MADFKFKSSKKIVRLNVEKETESGIVQKDLVFERSAKSYDVLTGLKNAMKSLEQKGDTVFDTAENAVNGIKQAFETVAPGQWDEWFNFLESDIENMAALLELMLSKLTEEKKQIVPENAEEV